MDMDGVLADTEGVHVRAWDLALDGASGPDTTEARQRMSGMSSIEIARELVRQFQLPLPAEELVEKKRQIFRSLIQGRLAPFEGLAEELARWREGPLGLATSSARAETTLVLGQLGFEGWFDPVVTCDDVARAKPAPDCYALAIERLGVPASRCVVVEDSPHGVRAARAAGAAVLAVNTSGLLRGPDGALGMFSSTVEALRWLRS